MSEVDMVNIGRKGYFQLDEVNQLLPIVISITEKYSQCVEEKMKRLEALPSSQTDLIDVLEAEINSLIKDWNNKIIKLGGEPKGLWLVDFDSGNGYFCWKFPEASILYWHNYTDGFTGRIPVENRPMHLGSKNVTEKPYIDTLN